LEKKPQKRQTLQKIPKELVNLDWVAQLPSPQYLTDMEVYIVTETGVPNGILEEVKKHFKAQKVTVIVSTDQSVEDFIEEIQASCSENSIFVTSGTPKTVAILAATISEMNELSSDTGVDMDNSLYYIYDFDNKVELEKIYPPC